MTHMDKRPLGDSTLQVTPIGLGLAALGRPDLAERVRLVAGDASLGYDVSSFNGAGEPLHIEVKSTTRDIEGDQGFWLSEGERRQGELDPHWVVYRVLEVDRSPLLRELGNIVQTPIQGWVVESASWRVHPDWS